MFVRRCTARRLIFKGCLLSPKHGDGGSLRACLLSFPLLCIYLALNTHKNTHRRTYTSTRVQIQSLHTVLTHTNKTHTEERLHASTDISLSISFCTHFSSLEENYFSARCFFFVYCEQTKALSAANHWMSNSATCCSHMKKKKKKHSVNNLLKVQIAILDLDNHQFLLDAQICLNSQRADQHLFGIICCDMLIASTCNSL